MLFVVRMETDRLLVPKLDLGMPVSPKLCFLVSPYRKFEDQRHSQVQLGNEGQIAALAREWKSLAKIFGAN